MANGYNVIDTKVDTFSGSKKPGISSLSNLFKKRWVFWVILGFILIALYTAGTYYVLFVKKDPQETRNTVFPTPFSATATPKVPTPTAVPTASPSALPTTGWQTYRNPSYELAFQYPTSVLLSVSQTPTGVDPDIMTLSYPDASPSGRLSINVQDTTFIGQSDLTSRALIALPVAEYAANKREQNFTYFDPAVSNRRVSALLTTTFLGQTAYSFTVTGSYNDDRIYLRLPEEYTFLITQLGRYKVIISYPTSDALFKKVLETMKYSG